MFYYKTEVNITDLVDELDLTGKKLLVAYLKEEMGEDFDVPPTDEEKNRLGLLEVEVEVEVEMDSDDVIDVIYDMSSLEREWIYEELHEEFGEEPDSDSPFSGGTYSEQEFGEVLNKLWEDRLLLNPDQKARIAAITKESYV